MSPSGSEGGARPVPGARMTNEELAELVRLNRLAEENDESSDIRQFYQDKTILITGASGFVGKVLIEKLLRACPRLGRIYVLIRRKRDQSAAERLEHLLGCVLFDGVRNRQPDLLAKVVAIEGDITRPLFGLEQEQISALLHQVQVVLHSAAVVGFEQPLKRACESNLIGLHTTIQLCLQMRQLLSLVYVSTAYVYCGQSSELDEHIYPANVDAGDFVELAKRLDVDTMELIKNSLLGAHPNTYTYTKSLAESLCGQYVDRLPIVVCRPSVIAGTWREPIPGYLDNLNAANGIYTFVAKGLVRTALGAPSKRFDLVPVDKVANCIIALGWFCHLYHAHRNNKPMGDSGGQSTLIGTRLQKFYEKNKQKVAAKGIDARAAELPVFNCTSGAENPIKLGDSIRLTLQYSREHPMAELFGRPSFAYTPSQWLNSWRQLVHHQLPAYALDLLATLGLGPRRNLVKLIGKADRFYGVLAYFMLRQWTFEPENRLALLNEFMSPTDRRLFNCDMKSIDWDAFFSRLTLGMRRFMCATTSTTTSTGNNSPGESLAVSRNRLRLLTWRDSLVKLVCILATCYLANWCYNRTSFAFWLASSASD